MTQTPFVIGICGGTGSGKTTITNRLSRTLSGSGVLVLQQDHYYKDLSHLPIEERSKHNFDHPNALDTDLFIQHVEQLRNGQAIERPVYDFTQHRRVRETVRVESQPAILIEGILIFENEALRNLMDIKIFVDTDADLRFIRRLVRDIRDRGRTLESVIEQYEKTVRPMHLEFVEPSKRYADIIIPEGGHNEVGIDLVIQKVRSLVAK
ncbi:MAG TPA: uridine kinase [Candidatus Limnocylindrales bacterium]|nr:uridine kinase [Candidatus Limnocylindrales bacterium]